MDYECAVVGAGPAGLSSARYLTQAGVRTIVLEANSAVGGRTISIRNKGAILNTGAAFFGSFYRRTLDICRDLGVELVRPPIHPGRSPQLRCMVTADGTYPYGPGSGIGFLTFPLVPWHRKARFLFSVASYCARSKLHLANPASLAPYDDEDARSWAIRTLGEECYQYYIRPAIEPFFYFGAEEVSAGFAKALIKHAPTWTLVTPSNGMGSFCNALARSVTCVQDATVRQIQPIADGFALWHTSGRITSRFVILAIPATVAATLDAPISDEDRDTLTRIRYASNVVLFFGNSKPTALPYPSMVPGGPGPHRLVGITSLSRAGAPGYIPKDTDVNVILATGWRSRELLGKPDGEIVNSLLCDAKEELGLILPHPEWFHLCTRRDATVIPTPGHFRQSVQFLRRTRRGLHFAGDWLTGSTVEGAVRSGEAAARAVLSEFRQVSDDPLAAFF